MSVTQRIGPVGAAGVGLGVIIGEGISQGADSGVLTQRQADSVALGVGGGAIAMAALGELGVVAIPRTRTFGIAAFATGELGWYVGRRLELLPRLIVDVPNEINLAGPITTSLVFALVGAGATALVAAT